MKIAIIGAGISGLGCAHLLHKIHDTSVFEANDRIGGHTATMDITHKGKDYGIDTGFIVFNDRTYPHFNKLLSQLRVEAQNTEMSFSVSCQKTGLEYSGSSFDTFFTQRKNFLSPKHWLLLKDILRFNKEATQAYHAGTVDKSLTLGQFLRDNDYSETFTQQYLIPMGSAIWSTSLADMMKFPAYFFIRFFHNHGLLSINNRPQWKVIKGGSKSYLEPLTQGFEDKIFCNSKIQSVTRTQDDVSIIFENGETQVFDHVVFSCHSDQALSLLGDPSYQEQSILNAIPYSENSVILHTDTTLLPKNKKAWASWNYQLAGDTESLPTLSYNMNILQGIDAEDTFVVTLNGKQDIAPEHIIGEYHYAHPQFSLKSIAAQEQWLKINGNNRAWFCGAYWRNGFHEDGFWSAIQVANALGAHWPSS